MPEEKHVPKRKGRDSHTGLEMRPSEAPEASHQPNPLRHRPPDFSLEG